MTKYEKQQRAECLDLIRECLERDKVNPNSHIGEDEWDVARLLCDKYGFDFDELRADAYTPID